MKNILQNPKINFSIGFLLLPFILVITCIIMNAFIPETLRFPKASAIFFDLLNSLKEKKTWFALLATFKNVFSALIVAFFSGIFLGLVLGHSNRIWNISQPTVDFFRSIPVTFLIPAFALLIGVTSSNIIWLLATYPCILIIILNVRVGLSKLETERVLSYSIISGSSNSIKKFFRVTLFEILPNISTGLRIALSYCIVIVTVLEYMKLGNQGGIGGIINDELGKVEHTRVYALIFLVGFVGFILNKIVEILDFVFLHWSKTSTDDR